MGSSLVRYRAGMGVPILPPELNGLFIFRKSKKRSVPPYACLRCNSYALSSFSFYPLKRFNSEVIIMFQAPSVVFDLTLNLYFNVLLNRNEVSMCMNPFVVMWPEKQDHPVLDLPTTCSLRITSFENSLQ